MTSYVIRLVSPDERESRADVATAINLLKRVQQDLPAGQFLVSSNPNARGGRGMETWSPDIADAKRFPTKDAAMECWRAQSTKVPRRPDGKPNRPMTAYSVVIEELVEPLGPTIIGAG